MYTAVVKFDTLSDTVWSAAENHDLFLVRYGRFIFCIVRRIVICTIFCTTYTNRLPALCDTKSGSCLANLFFCHIEDLCQITVGKTIFFCFLKDIFFRHFSFICQKRLFFLYQFFHLLDKIMFDLCALKQFFHGSPFTKCLIHDKLTLTCRIDQHLHQFILCFLMEIFGKSQTITSDFQTADSLLECFFIIFTDTHNFADSTHLCSQLVLGIFEFFKCPSGKFNNNIISAWHIFVQCTIDAAWNLIQGKSGRKHRRYECDRESCRFGCQCGRTGRSRIDLDNNDSVRYRIMGKLHIGSTDYLYFIYNFICLLLKAFLNVFGDGKHRRGTEGISCVYSERVNILDKADRDHISFCITHYFQFQFFPSENGFFDQYLTDKTCLKSTCADGFQFFYIIYKSAAGSSHRISRTKNDRITEFIRDLKGFFYRIRHFASCHLDAKFIHRLFEFDTVFSTLDRIHLNTDYFYIVFI